MKTLLLIAATTALALMAGLFYAWSVSVTPGLARLGNAEYIRAMQAMNRAILNPLFFICFFGTLVLLPLAAFLNYSPKPGLRFWLLFAASVLYLFGVFGTTVIGNVPLNESLNTFQVNSAPAGELVSRRNSFEIPWNQFNTIRTISSLLALIAALWACVLSDIEPGEIFTD